MCPWSKSKQGSCNIQPPSLPPSPSSLRPPARALWQRYLFYMACHKWGSRAGAHMQYTARTLDAGGHAHSSIRRRERERPCNVAFFFSSSSFLGSSLLLLRLLLLTAARILMRRGRRRQCPLWECSPALLDEYHVCSISAAVVSVHRLHIGTRCNAAETAVTLLSPPKSTLLCCCTRCWKPPFSTLVSPSISVLF